MGREVVPRQKMATLELSRRKASFAEMNLGLTEEQAIAEANRCILCKVPGCVKKGCPLENRIPDWIALIQKGKFLEAAALTRTTSSMPEICSRVCPQDRLCEGSCALGIKQEPVAIGALERFVNDYARTHGDIALETAPPTGKSVAIIGAGPAGLAAAERLRALGHEVVLYDDHAEPGGLLSYGLPGFKIDPAVVKARWGLLAQAGVQFMGGWRLGDHITTGTLIDGLFDSVFVAVGTWKPVVPKLQGVDTKGVIPALKFLAQAKQAGRLEGKHVVILGGGDTAMDCARSAIRLGAAASTVAYRRDEANMPGSKKEVKNAKEEGVEFRFLVSPVGFVTNLDGTLKAVRVQHMELGEPDKEGRRIPRAVPNSEIDLPADLAVLSFGFSLDASWVAKELGADLSPDGNILINEQTGATTRVGVFAGGDCTLGADLVCRAVRAGRRAAAGIHHYLSTGDWMTVAPVRA